ncbi:MAG: hypothetical protein ACK5JF_03785 [Oscillospiraceae bacterium]
MTAKELSQLYYLNREIDQDKQRLAELEAAATSTTPKISGLPHASGISDKVGLAAEIADLKSTIEAKAHITIALYNRIHRFAASLDDSLMRQVITLKYANCLTWYQVAQHVPDDPQCKVPFSGDALRKRTERYLDKYF